MELYTDQKGVQIYTANDLKLTNLGKNGVTYEKHGAVCMETQAFPNCMKFSHFPSSILKKYEKYSTTTYYKFI